MVLPVHEFENLFIDEKIITKAANAYISVIHGVELSEEVCDILKKYADDSLEDTKRKYINNSVREELKKIANLVRQKEIDISNKTNYEQYIDSLLVGEDYMHIIDNTKEKYVHMNERYGVLNWSSGWREVCDGKRVYSQAISEIAKRIGVSAGNLNKKVYDMCKRTEESELRKFWESVRKKLI